MWRSAKNNACGYGTYEPMGRPPRPQLDVFTAINAEEKRTETKLPWKERYAIIQDNFSSATRLDWAEAFKDMDLFGRLIKDILRIDQNDMHTGPGPRPVLDQSRSRDRLRQLMGEDYSYEPFLVAFGVLAGQRSVRHLAAKVGLGKHITHDLLAGRRPPDLYALEQIAGGFDKSPSYFMEYRIAYVLEALGSHMELSPETTVDLYKKLRDEKNAISSRRPERRRKVPLLNPE